jgi:hemerythrin
VLRVMADKQAAGQAAPTAGKAHEILDFIKQHIATRDKRLADYVRQGL